MIEAFHLLPARSLVYQSATDKFVIFGLCLAAGGYLVWHAFGVRTTYRGTIDFLGGGMGLFIFAIVLTLSGLGYFHHVQKIGLIALLYLGSAACFWRFHRVHPEDQ